MSPFFVRVSKYNELLREAEGLRMRIKELTAEVDALKHSIVDLKRRNKECRKRILRSKARLNEVLEERDKLRNSVEALEKEREVFQKTIERLNNLVKRKTKKKRKLAT